MLQQSTSRLEMQVDTQPASTRELHVATLNVRYDGERDQPVPIPRDGAVAPQKRWRNWVVLPWAERRSRLIDCLLSTGPLDIVGFQEVYYNQVLDIQALLGDSYSHVGVGRDDGKQAGEYSPIFYDSTLFERVDWKTIWLSKTPEVPGSKGWDANLTRIATFLTLRRKLDSSLIHVINTHYDDAGIRSRAEASYIIREQSFDFFTKVEQSLDNPNTTKTAVVLLGDFNSPTNEAGYGNITSLEPVPSGKPAYTFSDTYTNLQARSGVSSMPRQSAPYGPEHTYTSFEAPGASGTGRIDFVFVGRSPTDPRTPLALHNAGPGWMAVRYACLDNYIERDESGWQGRWSDHRAVRVTLEWLGPE